MLSSTGASLTTHACLPLTWGLYLPQTWIDDPVRRAAAWVPDAITYQTKGELALAALDRVRAWGWVRAWWVLADAGYGTSHDFRAALTARGLPYCVQVAVSITGWRDAPVPPAPRPYRGHGARVATCRGPQCRSRRPSTTSRRPCPRRRGTR